jgi:hypothetical protein
MAAVLFVLPLIGAVTVGDVLAIGASVLSILLKGNGGGPKPPTFASMSSAWGNTLPFVYNSYRCPANVIQAGPIIKHDHKSKKGGPTYSQTIAVGICEGVRSVGRIWADKQVIYDPRSIAAPPAWQADTEYGVGDEVMPTAGGDWKFIAAITGTTGASQPAWNSSADAATRDGGMLWIAAPYVPRTKIGQQYSYTMRIYTGTETQLPDAALEEIVGVGKQPAYRGLVYIVFEDWDLSKYGNRIPNLEVEILGSGEHGFANDGEVFGHFGADVNPGQFLTDDLGNVYYINWGQKQIVNIQTLSATTLTNAQMLSDAVGQGYPGASFFGFIFPLAGKYFCAIADTTSLGGVHNYSVLLYEINTNGSVTAIGCKEYPCGTVDLGFMTCGLSAITGEIFIAGADFSSQGVNVGVFDTITGLMGPYALRAFSANRTRHIVEITGNYGAVPQPYLGYCLAFVGDTLYATLNKAHMDWLAAHSSGVGFNSYYKSLQPAHPDGVLISISLLSDRGGTLAYIFNGPVTDYGWPFSDEGKNLAGAPGQTNSATYDDWSPPGQVQRTDGTIDGVYFVRGYSDAGAENLVGLKQFQNGMVLGTIAGAPFGVWGSTINQPNAYFAGGAIYMSFSSPARYYARIGAFIPTLMSLADICADISARVGLVSGDYDFSGLATVFPKGCAVTSRDAARAFIESLQPAFLFDFADIGDKIMGTLRSNDTLVQTIPVEMLAAAPTASQVVDRISSMRNDDKEIPQDLAISYYDLNHDYQQGSQPARRSRVTQYSSGRNTVTVPVVMVPGEAATAVTRSLFLTWIERTPRKFNLPLQYLARTPGDVIAIQRDGENYFVRLTKVTLQPTLVIECESVSEDLGIYQVQVPASLSDLGTGSFTPGTINPPAPPVLYIMDTAALRPDELNSVGVYLAGSGNEYGARFDFENVFKSIDDSVFDFQQQLVLQATMGFAASILGDWPRWTVWDRVNTVDVQLYNGTLANASESDLVYNMANVLWLGNGEIIQFAEAELIDSVNRIYRLSILLRGRFGTEGFVDTHAANEAVVFPVVGPVVNQTYDSYEIGSVRYWKGTNDSPSVSETAVQTITMTTRRLMPFAPFFIRGSRDGSDNLTITGLRRMRWRGTPLWTPPETDNPVALEIDILNGSTVVRTLSSTLSANGSGIIDPSSFEAAYSAADQILDFGSPQASVETDSYELNALVGRGYGRTKAL